MAIQTEHGQTTVASPLKKQNPTPSREAISYEEFHYHNALFNGFLSILFLFERNEVVGGEIVTEAFNVSHSQL